MKKILLYSFLSLLSVSYCFGQDTLALRNGKKIVAKVITVGKEKVTYIIPPDSAPQYISTWRLDYISYPGGTTFNFTNVKPPPPPSKTSFYLSGDVGGSIPAASFKDAIVGTHFGIKATYYVSHYVGLVAKASLDLNGTGLNYISNDYWGGFYIFQQYLGGLTYRTGGKPGFPWIDFVGLAGLCKAANPVSEQGGGYSPLTINRPGNGTGFGYYVGVEFTSSSDHFCSLTFGAGCLGALFSYPHSASTVSNYDPHTSLTNNIISGGISKMGLALFQVYLGLNLRLKKPQR